MEYALFDYLLHPLLERSKPLAQILKYVEQGDSWVGIQNLQGSALAWFLAALRRKIPNRPIAVVAPGLERAEEIYDDVLFFRTPEAYHFPKWETLPYDEDEPHLEILAKQLDVFSALNRWRLPGGVADHAKGAGAGAIRKEGIPAGVPPLVITSIDALLHKILPPDEVDRMTIQLHWGDCVKMDDLGRRLTDSGYERTPTVESRGEYSLRGGIVDVYPPNADNPLRIDFFGDEIESIRRFDASTQRSTEDLGVSAQVEIPPARLREPMFEHLAGGGDLATFFDALPANTLFVLDERERFGERAEHLWQSTSRQFSDFLKERQGLPRPETLVIGLADIEEKLEEFQTLSHSILPPDPDYLKLHRSHKAHGVSFLSAGYSHVPAQLESYLSIIKQHQAEDYLVSIICDNDGQIQRFDELLMERELSAAAVYPADEEKKRFRPRSAAEGYPDILLLVGSLHNGFNMPDIHACFLTDREIFGRYKRRHTYRRLYKGMPIAAAGEIQRGDYVVHVEHGIGRFLGMRQQDIDGRKVDLLEIEYAEGNKLLVPVENIRCVQKYSGTEAAPPALDKLGSSRWRKRSQKAREDIEKMAGELLELYARREMAVRRAFSPDTSRQAEFEASFLYRETPDQWSAITQVKRDMEREKPMDRLVCGDVGYGKTEVAIRAIFKCIQEGRQAAILVPTTILALQHYNTLRERFADYPIQVDMLSRFKSSKEIKEIIQKIKDGAIQVVVGTHRLLSNDIAFADLGLVVVDEEQRFGVRHKERLKQLRSSVDFLTLTATPIPRTLYMALSGLRDLSVINTPPPDRLPIKTRIIHFEEDQIAEAILRELNRGGQVFFVHNRIHNIHEIVERIQKIVPHARIAIGHGQMDDSSLEDVMMDFIDRKYDILVSTTIIENGLDIPNCNTIIINRADAFGLAQLYQLRGRVGRERRRAYAYLIVPQGQMITETAAKRLAAIEEFTELGVGFNIALRDMEIRGTGNILGAEQHGTIDQIGFEMYCEMLEEAVRKMRGEEAPPISEVEIKWKLECTLPPSFIPVESQRIAFYKRIAGLRTLAELTDLTHELEDRYGDSPAPAQNLLRVSRLRILASGHSISLAGSAPLGVRLSLSGSPIDFIAKIRAAQNKAKLKGFGGVRAEGQDALIALQAPSESAKLEALIALLELAS